MRRGHMIEAKLRCARASRSTSTLRAARARRHRAVRPVGLRQDHRAAGPGRAGARAGRVALGNGEVWQDDAQGLFVPPHRRPLGYVIQEAALFPHLDVRRNLAYGQKRRRRRRSAARVDQVVDCWASAR
jgi:molybdate transport system ATP-binding protein